jgi:hypothetical protein
MSLCHCRQGACEAAAVVAMLSLSIERQPCLALESVDAPQGVESPDVESDLCATLLHVAVQVTLRVGCLSCPATCTAVGARMRLSPARYM